MSDRDQRTGGTGRPGAPSEHPAERPSGPSAEQPSGHPAMGGEGLRSGEGHMSSEDSEYCGDSEARA
ncbi:hypothetical protein ACFYXM_03930 [Streptomyces sp. NPDC002476]|uniref:hypothetical protein n=1 Tax=Streptomyces sp. NPDC002476 TaxID=3364648 RepID=UPI0036B408D9